MKSCIAAIVMLLVLGAHGSDPAQRAARQAAQIPITLAVKFAIPQPGDTLHPSAVPLRYEWNLSIIKDPIVVALIRSGYAQIDDPARCRAANTSCIPSIEFVRTTKGMHAGWKCSEYPASGRVDCAVPIGRMKAGAAKISTMYNGQEIVTFNCTPIAGVIRYAPGFRMETVDQWIEGDSTNWASHIQSPASGVVLFGKVAVCTWPVGPDGNIEI